MSEDRISPRGAEALRIAGLRRKEREVGAYLSVSVSAWERADQSGVVEWIWTDKDGNVTRMTRRGADRGKERTAALFKSRVGGIEFLAALGIFRCSFQVSW